MFMLISILKIQDNVFNHCMKWERSIQLKHNISLCAINEEYYLTYFSPVTITLYFF